MALLFGVSIMGSGSAFAKDSKERFRRPDQAGAYSIGHITVEVTDPSRNPDGTTPATSPGRPLHLDIWYPTRVATTEHIAYTWNNPIYNENPGGSVYPGLPDLASLTAEGSPSFNPVLEGAPLAKGEFPLLVGSHGNLVASAKNMPDTLETLASHGYVVMSVEHTGNDDAWYQADWLGRRLGLPIGPNPSIGAAGNILQRTKDVSFVIDAALDGTVDRNAGIRFSKRIDDDKIGVLGFSLGGQTSLATVTGIGSAGYPADRRVKAALMGGGTNYGLLLDSADYANAEVPLMFLGNDTGIVYNSFNQFSGTREKYLVDIADFNHHVGGYQSSWCSDFQNSMQVVNPAVFPAVFSGGASSLDPSDIADYIFDATFYFSYTGRRESGVYDYCEPSVFDGISDEQLVAVLFGDPRILGVRDELRDSMPLKPEASIAETTRLTTQYAVSFFNTALKHDGAYSRFLNTSASNERQNPMVRLVKDCLQVPAHPLDLRPGDKITFSPVGDSGYDLSVTSGASLYDQGPTVLRVNGNGVAYLDFAGFSFPVPGMADPVEHLIVNENGVISTRTAPDIGGIDDNGSPWYMKGHLLLSGQFTIGALMKDLTTVAPGAVGGHVYGYLDAAEHRVIVTYRDVPAAGTTAPNTLQIAIYDSGAIEMIVGELAPTGAAYSPGILGTIGVAGGHTRIADLRRVEPVSFGELRDNGSVFVQFGGEAAIFEQFDSGSEASCGRHDDRHEHDGS
jgi:dienelactone hydrolase